MANAQSTEFARGGLADPREPRMGIGFLRSNLFADALVARPGQGLGHQPPWDTHGVVQLGLARALLTVGQARIGIQGASTSRFRIDTSDNDALSVDYMIALPVTFPAWGTRARLRLIHRSAHLGDELVQNTTIRRLEYDHDEVDVQVRRALGPLTVYLGGAWTFASSYESDDGALQAGIEGVRAISKYWAFSGAVDWQRHGIQEWGDQVNAVVAVERNGLLGGGLRLQARWHQGRTHLGEFFLETEKAWGVELIFGS